MGRKPLADQLRLELAHDKIPISVTAVMPASIDTPFFEHAGTRLGVAPKPLPPLYDPQRVADAILRAAVWPARVVIVGGSGQAMVRMHRHFPRLTEAMLRFTAFRQQRTSQPKQPTRPTTSRPHWTATPGYAGLEGEGARDLRRRRRRTRAVTASVVGLGALALWGTRRARA
jgi:hypothetical protein